MTDLLGDYELKRRRAVFHLDVLEESMKGFTHRNRHSVRGEPDPDGTKYLFHVPLEPLDPDWALIVGDFVYERRASLDYLITALIRNAGNEESETSQFPIYGIDRISWEEIDGWWESDPRRTIERNLDGTPPGTKAALKKLQPFYGVPAVDPTRHPLFSLQVLSNRDKHRRLNLLARNATEGQFVDAGGKPIFVGPPLDWRITQGNEGDTYTVVLNGKFDVDVYLLASHDVRFDEPPELISEVIETLTNINEFIDSRVLPVVRHLLSHP